MTERFRLGEALDHQRERFGIARLALAQFRHRLVAARVAGEMVSADSLDGGDPSSRELANGERDRVLGGLRRSDPQRRPARGTADRLGMESPVSGILVLGAALLAHPEARHRRALAIVRRALDDRQPRPAIGAVDERIAVPAVCRIEQLAQAVVASAGVRRNERLARSFVARLDAELRFSSRLRLADGNLVEPGKDRSARAQLLDEAIERFPGSLHLDVDGAGPVSHASAKAEPGSDPVYERAEADALDHAGHIDRSPGRRHARIEGRQGGPATPRRVASRRELRPGTGGATLEGA